MTSISTHVPPPRCYVAGKMRGMPDYNFPAFHEAAETLRALGWEVRNPAEYDILEGYHGWEAAMERDIELVLEADCIVALPHWYESEGATLEVYIANAIGKPVLNYKTLLPIHEDDLPQHVFHKTLKKERPATNHE